MKDMSILKVGKGVQMGTKKFDRVLLCKRCRAMLKMSVFQTNTEVQTGAKQVSRAEIQHRFFPRRRGPSVPAQRVPAVAPHRVPNLAAAVPNPSVSTIQKTFSASRSF